MFHGSPGELSARPDVLDTTSASRRTDQRRPLEDLAVQPPRCDLGAVAQGAQLRPHDILGDAAHARPRCRSRNRCRRCTRSGSPTAAAMRSIRSATTSGCSTKFVSVSITPAMRADRRRAEPPSAGRYSCAWRGLAKGRTNAPTFARQDRGQDVAQRDVVVVRAFIIAPADMQPDLLARDVRERLVDRRDDGLDERRRSRRAAGRDRTCGARARDRGNRAATESRCATIASYSTCSAAPSASR